METANFHIILYPIKSYLLGHSHSTWLWLWKSAVFAAVYLKKKTLVGKINYLISIRFDNFVQFCKKHYCSKFVRKNLDWKMSNPLITQDWFMLPCKNCCPLHLNLLLWQRNIIQFHFLYNVHFHLCLSVPFCYVSLFA